MNPAIDEILRKHSSVNVLHFFSDGPTNQYREKGNLYLFTSAIANRGLLFGTWNFHDAGHGKGIPDAVGATVKRMVDRLVSMGTDIPTAYTLYTNMIKTNTAVHVYFITEKNIQSAIEGHSGIILKPIVGSMRIHQLLTKSPGELCHRVVSCFCSENRQCDCFNKKTINCGIDSSYKTEKKHSIRRCGSLIANAVQQRGRKCRR